ncbi:hypothetical protein EV424DRAFT_1534837 [Suillus variegatus]|nr:hypothetical protein EV424DRAFT_1534837 [Suillus variegatus]
MRAGEGEKNPVVPFLGSGSHSLPCILSSNIDHNILGRMPRTHKSKRTQSKRPTPITQFKRPDRDHVARGWGPHRYTSITNPLPDNESTQKFHISSHITGRLMELKEHQIYTVEFLNPDGARVASDDLELLERRCDGSLTSIPESRMFPSFRHLYFITPDDRVYEVHFGHRIVSTITFPRRAEVVVHGALASQSKLSTIVT